jgi:hypothetical protein
VLRLLKEDAEAYLKVNVSDAAALAYGQVSHLRTPIGTFAQGFDLVEFNVMS